MAFNLQTNAPGSQGDYNTGTSTTGPETLLSIRSIDHEHELGLVIPDIDPTRQILNELVRSAEQQDSIGISSLVVDGVMAAPNSTERIAIVLGLLGEIYAYEYTQLGRMDDIGVAINCNNQAISLTPDEHPHKPRLLNNLGVLHQRQFKRLGAVVDLDIAVKCHNRALLLTPDRHPDKPSLLKNLGDSHHCRFEQLGELEDLSIAFQSHSEAVEGTPNMHPDRPGRLSSLGRSHRTRFERLGDLTDLDFAVEYQRQAVLHTPDGHPDKPNWLGDLGKSHRTRFRRLGELADLSIAIDYQSQAVSLMPDEQPEKPGLLDSLGSSYHSRFECLGQISDIDIAIKCQGHAVSLAPDGQPDKPGLLNNLGNSHQSRFYRLGDLVDLDVAFQCQNKAASLTPDRHPDRPGLLNNLGNTYHGRFQRLGTLEDLDTAIEYQSEAVSSTPDGHPDKTRWLSNLGESYKARFQHLGEPVDIHQSIDCFKIAAQSSQGHPFMRLTASRIWAQLSSLHLTSTSLEAYQQVMTLVPQVVWLGSTVNRRYEHIASINDVAVEAAAVAIQFQMYDLAIEWLEEGRSIVWKQLLQLRTPLDELFECNTALAEEIKLVARDLDHLASLKSGPNHVMLDQTSLEHAARHRRLAEKWGLLVDQVRHISGMKNFLRPKKASDLMAAARSGAVAIINVHRLRCDALVLRPKSGDIACIPLNSLSYEKAARAHTRMVSSLHSQGLMQRGRITSKPPDPVADLESISAMLWTDVAKPVLEFLGYMVCGALCSQFGFSHLWRYTENIRF
jgi:tetratricopeptide (TPR) repeat protein